MKHAYLMWIAVLGLTMGAISLVPHPRAIQIPKDQVEKQPEACLHGAVKGAVDRAVGQVNARWQAEAGQKEKAFKVQKAKTRMAVYMMYSALVQHEKGNYRGAKKLLAKQAVDECAALKPLAAKIRGLVSRRLTESEQSRKDYEAAEKLRADGKAPEALAAFERLQYAASLPRELAGPASARLAEIRSGAQRARRGAWDGYEQALRAIHTQRRLQARALLERLGREAKGIDPELDRRIAAALAGSQSPKGAADLLANARKLIRRNRFAEARKALAQIEPLQKDMSAEEARDVTELIKTCERYAVEQKIAAKAPPGMVAVYSGPFRMGASDSLYLRDESPAHIVYINFFFMDRREVTCREYQKFLLHIKQHGNAGYYAHKEQPRDWDHTPMSRRPEDKAFCWRGTQYPQGMADRPVMLAAYWDAYAFAKFRGKRLPTEAEWEKAARGVDGRLWPWGETFDPNLCNSQEGKAGATTAVGAYPKGASPYGVLDMAGNASEWCHDWYHESYYRETPARNPGGPYKGRYRLVRGGSFLSNETRVRTYKRTYRQPGLRFRDVGFRCVADPAD